MLNEIYFDNSATTPLCNEAKSAMTSVIENVYGNPSSLHSVGLAAEKIITDARSEILSTLGVRTDMRQLIFCGSGSEANNLALVGSYTSKKRKNGARVIIGAGEHSSVEAAAKHLETLGADVVRLSTKNGEICFNELENALTPDTVLISLMLVNNETGALYPVADVFKTAKALCPDIICHCDAVQAYSKVKFTPKSLSADLVTVSAHKLHGPKGVAALYVSSEVLKRRAIYPIIHGGQQENGLRAGTENVVGIAGFGAAAADGYAHLARDLAGMRELRDGFLARLAELAPEVRPNLPPENAPHIASLTLPRIKSETMLNYLSRAGICISAGSACSSHAKNKTSSALLAYGLSVEAADSTVRVSLSPSNTEAELTRAAETIAEGVRTLVRF